MNKLIQQAINKEISSEQALDLAQNQDIHDLMYVANKVRHHYKGDVVDFCSIVNAKSGSCSEDCKFCAQSAHYNTQVTTHTMLDVDEIKKHADLSGKMGAKRFGIVTSGGKLKTDEQKVVCQALEKINQDNKLGSCASLGILDENSVKHLKEAGLKRYHHNLETSRSYFTNVCTTHDYNERVETIKLLKKNGFEVCCGGIFGLGEEWTHRIELAFELKNLDVDSIPLNFLHPVPGTPYENLQPLKPLEILRIISIYRLVLPDKDIRCCGGREKNLRDLQSWIYYAGANGTLIGNYLTTYGRPPEEDIQMIQDLGLRYEVTE